MVKKEPLWSCRPGAAASVAKEDLTAVASLPYWLGPPRIHAGPILANYLKQREKDHQTALQDLFENAAKLNDEIDAKIRTLAENVQCIINENQTDINCMLEDCKAIKSFTGKSRDEALNNVMELHARCVEEIANFKHDGVGLERERMHGLLKIFSDSFKILIAVGNKPPKDLLHDFDMRAYEANQQLLSNSRAFVNLEVQLRVQADASMRHARSSLNQLCLGISFTPRQHSAQLASRRISGIGAFSRTSTHECLAPPITSKRSILEEYNQCVQFVKTRYIDTLLNLFSGFSGSFIDLREGLGKPNEKVITTFEFESPRLNRMIQKLRRISINESTGFYNEATATYKDALKLSIILEKIRERLQTVFNMLNDATHLWDAHMMRSAFAQKMTMVDVEDLVTCNDAVELENEIPFTIALDQMRTSDNLDKLQQTYNHLVVLLDKMAELYLCHSNAEVRRVEEYRRLCTAMADMLLAEFNCFLERYSRAKIQPTDIAVTNSLDAQRDQVVSITFPLFRVVFQSEVQVITLENLQNGFLESFENDFATVPERLEQQAQSWVQKKIAVINARYALKMVSHSVRKERLKAAREQRLVELDFHKKRLASHVDAILGVLIDMPLKASELLSIDAPSLYPFCNYVAEIQGNVDDLLTLESGDSEKSKLKLASYPKRLAKHRAWFEASLNEALEEHKVSFENQLQLAKISNFQFMSALKLVNEGGSYSSQEAASTVHMLLNAAELIEDCEKKMHVGLENRRAQLLSMADGYLASLLLKIQPFGPQTQHKAKPPKNKSRM